MNLRHFNYFRGFNIYLILLEKVLTDEEKQDLIKEQRAVDEPLRLENRFLHAKALLLEAFNPKIMVIMV